MIKRIIAYIMITASVFMLTGCTSKDPNRHTWILATASPEDTVTQLYAEKFAEEVNRLSDGELNIEIYANSSLGGDTELLESAMCGDIPFVVQNTAPQVSYLPKLCLFDLPCVFADITDLHKVLDNEEFIERINDIYEEKGISLLGMSDQNFRVMTSNTDIKDIDDFSGIKIRTMENPYHMAFWSALGANPTPMAFSEVYIGLQQNTIDAQENPYEVIVSNKFYEQQDYIVQTNHLPHLLSLITNREFLEKMTDEQQNIIREAADIAKDYSREQALLRANDRIAICEKGGAKVISLSEDLRAQMKQASSKLYEQIRKDLGDDELYEMYAGSVN